MSSRIFKYGTGDEVPAGAVYLCTQVEREVGITKNDPPKEDGAHVTHREKNRRVWHYFLVPIPVPYDPNAPTIQPHTRESLRGAKA